MNFPTNAIDGDLHSWGGRQWRYLGGKWRSVATGVGRAEFEELEGRVNREVRIDLQADFLYVGRAAAGSEEADAVWTVRRSPVDVAGVVGASMQTVGAWSGRQNLIYGL